MVETAASGWTGAGRAASSGVGGDAGGCGGRYAAGGTRTTAASSIGLWLRQPSGDVMSEQGVIETTTVAGEGLARSERPRRLFADLFLAPSAR